LSATSRTTWGNFQFIKENDLTVKYRDKLAKLKNKQIDPNATGVFHEFEKKWEETMLSTYQKYVSAVANWKKAARWWLTKDELAKLTFSLGSKMAKMAAGNMLGFPLPSTSLADPEKLGDWILKMRGTLTKAVEKARGMEWARLDTEILDAEEERRALNVVFQEEIEAADMEARMQAVGVEQKHESALKSLERESQKAHLKLAKAGTDEQQERTAMADITRIEQRMIAEERAVQKEKRYWLEDWYQDQEEKAYDKLEAAVRKIDERIKELKAEKPR